MKRKGMGILSLLDWSVDDVSFWANWWLAGSLAVGVLATVAIIVSGNIKEVALKKDVAASNERAAKLEKQSADARLELARIDPMNLPIKSLRADVYLLIKGDFSGSPLKLTPVSRKTADLKIYTEGGARNSRAIPLAVLSCREIESAEAGFANPSTPTRLPLVTGRELAMTFDWPGSDFMTAHFASQTQFKLWISGDRSTVDLDKRKVDLVLKLFGLPNGLEIYSGSCILTINGSISRTFSVPATTEDGQVVFAPQ